MSLAGIITFIFGIVISAVFCLKSQNSQLAWVKPKIDSRIPAAAHMGGVTLQELKSAVFQVPTKDNYFEYVFLEQTNTDLFVQLPQLAIEKQGIANVVCLKYDFVYLKFEGEASISGKKPTIDIRVPCAFDEENLSLIQSFTIPLEELKTNKKYVDSGKRITAIINTFDVMPKDWNLVKVNFQSLEGVAAGDTSVNLDNDIALNELKISL